MTSIGQPTARSSGSYAAADQRPEHPATHQQDDQENDDASPHRLYLRSEPPFLSGLDDGFVNGVDRRSIASAASRDEGVAWVSRDVLGESLLTEPYPVGAGSSRVANAGKDGEADVVLRTGLQVCQLRVASGTCEVCHHLGSRGDTMPYMMLWQEMETYTSGDGYLDKLCMELVDLGSSRCRPPTRDVRPVHRDRAAELLASFGLLGQGSLPTGRAERPAPGGLSKEASRADEAEAVGQLADRRGGREARLTRAPAASRA